MTQKNSIKNRLKDLKKKNSSKRIQLKKKDAILSDLFDLKEDLYYSGFALTDNFHVILFSIDSKFLEKNNLTNELKEFNLNENDLQMKFNNKKELRPKALESEYIINNIGLVKKETLNWFTKNYPKCTLYEITEWFGKSVNTLILVLNEPHGKPVAVVKTYN